MNKTVSMRHEDGRRVSEEKPNWWNAGIENFWILNRISRGRAHQANTRDGRKNPRCWRNNRKTRIHWSKKILNKQGTPWNKTSRKSETMSILKLTGGEEGLVTSPFQGFYYWGFCSEVVVRFWLSEMFKIWWTEYATEPLKLNCIDLPFFSSVSLMIVSNLSSQTFFFHFFKNTYLFTLYPDYWPPSRFPLTQYLSHPPFCSSERLEISP